MTNHNENDARRLLETIMARHNQQNGSDPAAPQSGAHRTGEHTWQINAHTVITGGNHTHVHQLQPPDNSELAETHRMLQQVLQRLPEARLPRRVEQNVQRHATAALETTGSDAPPRRGDVRQAVHAVMIALMTGMASGGVNGVVQDLLRGLAHTNV